MSTLRLAVSFLSIFPAYGRRMAEEKEMARSLFFYSLVGFLLGTCLVLAAWLGRRFSLGLAGDALVVVLWIVLTGGLHLDGLMDTADGLFSGQERLRKLEIMKDSRIGAMGGMALASILLLKVAFLGLLPYPVRYGVLLSAPALGRAMMVFAIAYFPYARPDPGLGQSFGSQVSPLAFPLTLLVVLAGTYLAGGTILLICLVIAGMLAGMAAALVTRVLGGHTGDTYGAICEITETLMIMIVVLAVHW